MATIELDDRKLLVKDVLGYSAKGKIEKRANGVVMTVVGENGIRLMEVLPTITPEQARTNLGKDKTNNGVANDRSNTGRTF